MQELKTQIQARFPLIWMLCPEESKLDEIIYDVAAQLKRPIYFWNISRGWEESGKGKGNPMLALDRIASASGESGGIFVLRDLGKFMDGGKVALPQLPILRELKNLIKDIQSDRRTIIIPTQNILPCDELKNDVSLIEIGFPSKAEITEIIKSLVGKKLKLNDIEFEKLVENCQGLTEAQIRRILAKALVQFGKISPEVLPLVLEQKREIIASSGILEFIDAAKMLPVGGLENLKQWVNQRTKAWGQEARNFGLPFPKGILLTGVQGCGKSLSIKAIAHQWQLPLLRLDAGRLFGSLVGESESRIRECLAIAEAISPCILYLDEIDKAFANGGGDGDSGTSRRVFGSLITWMQEKTAPVFVAATANRIDFLPAELMRKGRFDEIFFVDLPTGQERTEIFKVHLNRFRPVLANNIQALEDSNKSGGFAEFADKSKGFSGAEIEQVVIDAMFAAFGDDKDLSGHYIKKAIAQTTPLSKIASDQINQIRDWASQNNARIASATENSVQSQSNKKELVIN